MSGSNNNLRWLYAICILLTVLTAVGVIREVFFPKELMLQNAQLLPSPRPLVSIKLGSGEETVDMQMLRSRWFLIFLGYTNCPDVCPVELQKLAQMLKRFEEAGELQKPVVIFVSVDYERDSQEKLDSYAKYFHPELAATSGQNIELAKLANFFGATYNRTVTINGKEYLVEAGADMPPGSGEHYIVNHSSRIFIINPNGEYVGSFSPPYTAEQLFADMQLLMK